MTAIVPTPPAPSRAARLEGVSAFSASQRQLGNYEALLFDQAEEHIFLTYDDGNLELMSPLPKQDRAGPLLARLIHAYTEVRGIPIATFGRTTWRKKSLAKGLEADECFYIRSEAIVRGREDIDLAIDPPPAPSKSTSRGTI